RRSKAAARRTRMSVFSVFAPAKSKCVVTAHSARVRLSRKPNGLAPLWGKCLRLQAAAADRQLAGAESVRTAGARGPRQQLGWGTQVAHGPDRPCQNVRAADGCLTRLLHPGRGACAQCELLHADDEREPHSHASRCSTLPEGFPDAPPIISIVERTVRHPWL